jgi:lipocalin-like protein
MASREATNSRHELARNMIGVWWLLSRIDLAADGSLRIDPALGAEPFGILTYAPSHFAAQFMKRDRSTDFEAETSVQGQNNTGAIGGYDAYFGTYEVNEMSGEVIHRLQGALTPDNIGLEVSRNLSVDGDRLEIELATTTADGEPVGRTLTWKRVG